MSTDYEDRPSVELVHRRHYCHCGLSMTREYNPVRDTVPEIDIIE